jgi:mono/diheme cytochrome c family protein
MNTAGRSWKATHSLLAGCGILLGAAFALGVAAPDINATASRTPEQLYLAACASCHGADGRGAPLSTVGFDVPLPDFSDCSFASREPDPDWWIVAHQGGPIRAFDAMMPAFGEALTGQEIEGALAHIRTFCQEADWPRGELNLPRPLFTEKAYPEDEVVLTTTLKAEGRGALLNKFIYERRFGARHQYEVVVPFGSRRKPENWAGGLGDIALALKSALYHDYRRGSIVSLTGEVILPTGDTADGFSKGVGVFEPFVTFGQILPADAFFQFQSGLELPIDTDKAPREGFWRAALGRSWAQGEFGRTWSPMVELLGAREFEDGAKTQWDLVPQVQVTLPTRQHIMANLGVRLPLTDADTRSTQVAFYLLWDWFDGGFLDGW